MQDLLDALEDLGYLGPEVNGDNAPEAVEGGAKSTAFTALVARISAELKALRSLEESVNATQAPDDASTFLLELSSFLKELGCPYSALTTGHLSSRLQTTDEKLLLLDFLLSELMLARLMAIDDRDTPSRMEITIQETPTAKDLKDILMALKFNKPPPDVTVDAIFAKIEARLKEKVQKEGPDYVGRPLYNKATAEKEWNEIEAAYRQLCDEYKMRREMLITRLDCTIQSFEWSERGVTKREEIQSVYRPLRSALKTNTSVKLSDFLAARNTLLALKKTSDASVRENTKSQVNKVIIGKVPDRGGRPSEQEPPPPEMPSWQHQRSQGGGDRGGYRGGGRGGGGGGRGGGGRGGSGFGGGSKVQGGWNPPKDQRSHHDGFGDRKQSFDRPDNRSYNNGNQSQVYPEQAYQQNQGYQTQGYHQSQGYQSQGYQQNPGYQTQGYQQNQGYQSQGHQQQSQNRGYSNQRQDSQQDYGPGKGRYQNEHDDRAGYRDDRGGGGGGGHRGRGRSNYNRGGRY